MFIFIGILIPFIGTTLGSCMVFLMKNKINIYFEKILLGFASGVMIAASIWSLIIPAIEMSQKNSTTTWIPASLGILLGVLFLILLDKKFPNFCIGKDTCSYDTKKNFKKTILMIIAVTLHNIPEGMAVGVIFAGVLAKTPGITLSSAFTFAIGIAIQNFPEGAIISMPLKSVGFSKIKSFFYGTLSGFVEPLAAFITILLTNTIAPILPYVLSFAAGAMIKVVVQELIPESVDSKKSYLGTISFTLGFLVMMILDVVFG